MVKKASTILGVLVLVVAVFGIALYGLTHSSGVQNYLIFSGWKISKEVRSLNNEINIYLPENTNNQRIDLLTRVDDFIRKSVLDNKFSIKPHLLIKLRLDKAMDEISKINISDEKVKLWYLYNMGVVAKSKDVVVAFDLPNTSIYSESANFAKHIDILVITHLHADHFDASVVREALKNGVAVILPDGSDIEKYNFNSDKLIVIKNSETITLKDTKITGYSAVHSSNIDMPVDWFLVEMSGKKLLHTGDGIEIKSGKNFSDQKIDVFLAHFDDDKNAEKIAKMVPNVTLVLPLHIIEIGHGREILDYMMYKNSLDGFVNGFWKHNPGARYIPLIWGESLEI